MAASMTWVATASSVLVAQVAAAVASPVVGERPAFSVAAVVAADQGESVAPESMVAAVVAAEPSSMVGTTTTALAAPAHSSAVAQAATERVMVMVPLARAAAGVEEETQA